jgi:hypothetical protein
VQIEPAPLGFLEIEGESVELLSAAQPDEAIFPDLNVGLQEFFETPAGNGCGAVRRDHQVVLAGILFGVGDFGFKDQLYAQAGGALLENLQELHTGDAAKSVTSRSELAAFEKDVDVVPVAESLGDAGMSLRIGVSKAAHGLVRKYDAPAEGAVGAVALDDGDVPGGAGLFREDREIESGGPASEANDFHWRSPSPMDERRESVMFTIMRAAPAVLPLIFCQCRRLAPLRGASSRIRRHPGCDGVSEARLGSRRNVFVRGCGSRRSLLR